MSGGRWNYDQYKVEELGEKLSKESDVVLAAIGVQLTLLAEWIDSADRQYSGDASGWKDGARDEALAVMAPVAIEVIRERAQDLTVELHEMQKVLDALSRPK